MTAWGALLFTSGCLVAVLSSLIKDEIRGWLDLLPSGILRLAALLLKFDQRKTIYEDEWVPELYHILRKADTRPISRLFIGIYFALGLLVSIRGISRQINRGPEIEANSPVAPTENSTAANRLTASIAAATGERYGSENAVAQYNAEISLMSNAANMQNTLADTLEAIAQTRKQQATPMIQVPSTVEKEFERLIAV